MERERKRKTKESRWKAFPTPQAWGGGVDSAYERGGDARRKF